MARAHGIDISEKNARDSETCFFDANKKGSGLAFIIVRASLGPRKDRCCDEHLKRMAPGTIKGAYHYFTYKTDWEIQADTFLHQVKGKGFHFYALDFEKRFGAPPEEADYIQRNANGAHQWLKKVSEALPGQRVLFYTNQDTYNQLQNLGHHWMSEWPFWLAWYTSKAADPPQKFSHWKFWQYSADGNYKGREYGVGSTHVDLNHYNGTVQELTQWLGLDAKKQPDKVVEVKSIVSDYTWQEVITAAQKVDGKRFGAWLKKAGVDAVLADRTLLTQPYSGRPIHLWPIERDKQAAILAQLGRDLAAGTAKLRPERVEQEQDDDGRSSYTWQYVIDATQEVDNKRFGSWLKKAGVDAVLADRTLLTRPYSGLPINQWRVEPDKRKEILKRLQANIQHDEDDRPHYTWQDVIDVVHEVDDKQFGSWLKKAGVDAVLTNRKLLTQPYSGLPINQWRLNPDQRKEILKRLGEITPPVKDPMTIEKSEHIKLDVTYISQFDSEAVTHEADCGPTCLAMIIRTHGTPTKNVSVDALYRYLPPKTAHEWTTLGEMKFIANKEELGAGYNQYSTKEQALDGLRQMIRAGRPFVALVNYGAWDADVHWGYSGGHFVVVTGFNENNVFVHDPLFRKPRRDQGAFYQWPNEKFLAGWGSLDPPHKSPNVNFAYVYTRKTVAYLKG